MQDSPQLVYSVKVTKTVKKSDYIIQTLKSSAIFTTLESLIEEIKSSLDVAPHHIGYIEPGHGMKGKNRWLTNDKDLLEMYSKYGKRKEYNLWCQCVIADSSTSRRKRSWVSEPDDKPSTTKKDSTKKESIMLSIQEVEDIVKKLQTQHGSLMKVEQYNAWAHMINTGKHSSYDEPPELPYFKKSKKTCEVQVGADGPDVAKVAVTTLNVRSECISQLEKWHSLYEKKCITEEQYDQLKKSILQDVFNC